MDSASSTPWPATLVSAWGCASGSLNFRAVRPRTSELWYIVRMRRSDMGHFPTPILVARPGVA